MCVVRLRFAQRHDLLSRGRGLAEALLTEPVEKQIANLRESVETLVAFDLVSDASQAILEEPSQGLATDFLERVPLAGRQESSRAADHAPEPIGEVPELLFDEMIRFGAGGNRRCFVDLLLDQVQLSARRQLLAHTPSLVLGGDDDGFVVVMVRSDDGAQDLERTMAFFEADDR